MDPAFEFSPLIYPFIHRFEFVASAADHYLERQGRDQERELLQTIDEVQGWHARNERDLTQTEQICTLDYRNVLTAIYGLHYFLEHPELDPDPKGTRTQFDGMVGELRELCLKLANNLRECYLLAISDSPEVETAMRA